MYYGNQMGQFTTVAFVFRLLLQTIPSEKLEQNTIEKYIVNDPRSEKKSIFSIYCTDTTKQPIFLTKPTGSAMKHIILNLKLTQSTEGREKVNKSARSNSS